MNPPKSKPGKCFSLLGPEPPDSRKPWVDSRCRPMLLAFGAEGGDGEAYRGLVRGKSFGVIWTVPTTRQGGMCRDQP